MDVPVVDSFMNVHIGESYAISNFLRFPNPPNVATFFGPLFHFFFEKTWKKIDFFQNSLRFFSHFFSDAFHTFFTQFYTFFHKIGHFLPKLTDYPDFSTFLGFFPKLGILTPFKAKKAGKVIFWLILLIFRHSRASFPKWAFWRLLKQKKQEKSPLFV